MGKSALRIVCIILVSLTVCVAFLSIWTQMSEDLAHTAPAIEMVSIEEIVARSDWTAADFEVLTEQTGLSQEALSYLKEQGRQAELPAFQEMYFRPIAIACEPNSIISREEYVIDGQGEPAVGMSIPYIEEGDILITCCSHVFGWRNGHVALVVDADKRLVLEAQVLGTPSVVTRLDYWERYPSFIVLRLEGADKEERAAIAAFALENMVGVPYHVTAGIFERLKAHDFGDAASGENKLTSGRDEAASGHNEGVSENGKIPSGTQCAHLIWYAYHAFGYDLDSDGGLIVTPRDIAGCEKLKNIQHYGVGSLK